MLSRIILGLVLAVFAVVGFSAGAVACSLLAVHIPPALWLVALPLLVGLGGVIAVSLGAALMFQGFILAVGVDRAAAWADLGSEYPPLGIGPRWLVSILALVLRFNGRQIAPNSSLKRTNQSLRD